MKHATPKSRPVHAALAAMLLVGALGAVGPARAADAVAGNATDGATKAAMCIGCHGIVGYRASFPEVYEVPKIAGQTAGYIRSALDQYRKGERRHPTMRAIATSLSDQDVADLGAYYQDLGKERRSAVPETAAAASPDVARILEKGACASCHGANFSKPIDPSYPKLAGQHPDYLYAAMRAYLTENNNVIGRTHAIMGPQLKNLQVNHAALKSLSGYLGSLPAEIATVRESGLR